MQFFGIDPGANYTGVAFADVSWNGATVENVVWDSIQLADPAKCGDWIRCRRSEPPLSTVFVLEDYISAGQMDKYAKETLKALGYFRYTFPCYMQVPQARLAFVEQAKEVCKALHPDLTSPDRKDMVAAVAHVMRYLYDAYGYAVLPDAFSE